MLGAGASVPLGMPTTVSLLQRLEGETDRLRGRSPRRGRMKRKVVVNDRMQHGCIYYRTEPVGRNAQDGEGGDVLSYQQRYVWLAVQKYPDLPHSNIELPIRLHFDADPDLLEACLRFVIHRHEALRTGFQQNGTGAEPIAFSAAQFRLARTDLSAMDVAAAEDAALALVAESARTCLPAHDLPVRASFVRMGPAGGILILTFHHLACDGRSLMLIMRELLTLYEARLQERVHGLDAVCRAQQSHFSRRQIEFLDSGRSARTKQFWRDKLSGKAYPALVTSRPRPDTPPTRLSRYQSVLDADFTARIERFCTRSRKSYLALFVAALNLTLHRLTGEVQPSLVTVLWGGNAKKERVVGYLSSLLILQTDLSGNPGPEETLTRTAGVIREAIANRDVPYFWIIENIFGRNPERLPPVAINYIPIDSSLMAYQEFKATPIDAATELYWNGVDFCDLWFRVLHAPGSIVFDVRYDGRFLSEGDIRQTTALCHEMIDAICAE